MQNIFCTFYSCPYHNNCNRKLQEEIEKQYTYQDEHGKSCDKWENFPTNEEAVKRQRQIEHELATGNFLIGHGKHRPCRNRVETVHLLSDK